MSHSQFEHIGGVLLKQNIPIYVLDLSNKPIESSLLVSSDYIGRKAFIFRSMGFHPPCLRSEQVLEFLSADVIPRVAHVRTKYSQERANLRHAFYAFFLACTCTVRVGIDISARRTKIAVGEIWENFFLSFRRPAQTRVRRTSLSSPCHKLQIDLASVRTLPLHGLHHANNFVRFP